MTTPSISHRRVLRIAVPIVLSNATIPILGAVDTGVVGQIGLAAPVGAVGIGAVILASLYWIFGFLRMGTSGLVAQAHGAGDAVEVGALLVRGLLIGLGAGLIYLVLSPLLFQAAFHIAPASEEVEDLARAYMSVRIWGAPATIAIYALTGWLIAMERTRGVLWLQLGMNMVNVVLDLWFVLGLGWGVVGVAWATLAAEFSGLVIGLYLCRDAFADPMSRAASVVFDRVKLIRMAAVNGDILIRSVLLQASFTSFLFLGAGLGDVQLAANQVLMQFLQFTAFGLDGFAFAAETLVGQALGRRNRPELRSAAIVTSQWGVAVSVGLCVVFWIFGPMVIDIMTTAPDVRIAAREYLPWIAVAPVVGIASWMLDGVFIGATRTGPMRNAMILSVAIYVVAVLILLPQFGNHGLWAALMVLNTARGVTLALRYPALEAAV